MQQPCPDILCVGSVLWDIIGRSHLSLHAGSDVPGRVTRLPGGVAMNIAVTLARFGLTPALLTAIGRDAEGEELIAACRRLGLITDHVYRSPDLATDRYMAIEGAGGLIAAVADVHSLEAAGPRILTALTDGTLGSAASPWSGLIALDGNLTEALLAEIATDPAFAAADLRLAPASPGKAERLRPLLKHPRATLYVNLEEARLLTQTDAITAAEAAEALLARGVLRVLVTDGGRPSADGSQADGSRADGSRADGSRADGSRADGSRAGIIVAQPPQVLVARVTGAGDTFMAAHIVAERRGAARDAALQAALQAAAAYVSGDIGT